MHQVTTDVATGIIEVQIDGFWDEAEVADFANDLRAAANTVTATGKRHRMLYDYTGSSIQSQKVIGALQELARTMEPAAERIALFTCGQLARLQAGRIAAVRQDIRLFDDRALALAWLRGTTETGDQTPGADGTAIRAA